MAEDKANGTFGFITASPSETYLSYGGGANMTLNIPEGTIPLNVEKTYYLYLWVQNGKYFYPDFTLNDANFNQIS